MKKILKEHVNGFLSKDKKPDYIFSIFNKWLTEEECEAELITASEVNSLDDYHKIRKIELQYVKLLLVIDNLFTIINK